MAALRIFVLLAVALCGIDSLSYRDHKVILFKVENENQLREAQSLEFVEGVRYIDVPEYVGQSIAVVISPQQLPLFQVMARSARIDYKITAEDLQSLIDDERPKKQRKDFTLDDYNTLEEIYDFVDQMGSTHPTATVYNIGTSYEGRQIKAIRIQTNPANPAIFIESTIHAREWISPATSVWFINEILTTTDPTLRSYFDSLTWYFVPVTNPDGYAWTWSNDRLWRKSRSQYNILCWGVDQNRNFGFNWGQGGSSTNACSDTYMGPAPFSEPENVALMDFYASVASQVEMYLCWHSAAKLLMYPLGNTASTENVPNAAHLHEIAGVGVAALQEEFGTVYQYGNAMQTLYVTSGSSRDHAYGHFKTPLVFTYEMREGPSNIFILPREQIHPNSKEILNSLVAIVARARTLDYFQQRAV